MDMALPNNSGSAEATFPKIDEELTYLVLSSQARRKLLVGLAVGGPQTGAALKHLGRGGGYKGKTHYLDSTLKNLKLMVESGVVVAYDDPKDGRRTLYGLSPNIKVTRNGDEVLCDLGFGVTRLSVDGN